MSKLNTIITDDTLTIPIVGCTMHSHGISSLNSFWQHTVAGSDLFTRAADYPTMDKGGAVATLLSLITSSLDELYEQISLINIKVFYTIVIHAEFQTALKNEIALLLQSFQTGNIIAQLNFIVDEQHFGAVLNNALQNKTDGEYLDIIGSIQFDQNYPDETAAAFIALAHHLSNGSEHHRFAVISNVLENVKVDMFNRPQFITLFENINQIGLSCNNAAALSLFFGNFQVRHGITDFQFFHLNQFQKNGFFQKLLSLIQTVLSNYAEIILPLGVKDNDIQTFLSQSIKYYDQPVPWFPTVSNNGKTLSAQCLYENGDEFSFVLLGQNEHKQEGRLNLSDLYPQLLFLSGHSIADLNNNIKTVKNRFEACGTAILNEVAAQLAVQAHGPFRVSIAATQSTVNEQLTAINNLLIDATFAKIKTSKGLVYGKAKAVRPKLAFLFPGQGPQYKNMLLELALYSPMFKKMLQKLDSSLAGVANILPSQSIYQPVGKLSDADLQTLNDHLFSMEGGAVSTVVGSLGVFDVLERCGIKADTHVGHSNGENTALFTSGTVVFDDRDEIFDFFNDVCGRGRRGYEEGDISKGLYLAISTLDRHFIDGLIQQYTDDVNVAMDNCPHQLVVFIQDTKVQAAFVEELQQHSIIHIPLPFDRAYHTPLFESEMDFIRAMYKKLPIGKATTPMFSCIDGTFFPDDVTEIAALLGKQWTNCVKFRGAIEQLYAEGYSVFIEIGPGGSLTSFVNDTLSGKSFLALSTDVKSQNSVKQIQAVLARLFVEGFDVKADIFERPVISKSTAANLPPVVPQLVNDVPPLIIGHQPEVVRRPERDDTIANTIMTRHFELMDEFLAQQNNIHQLIFNSLSGSTQLKNEPLPGEKIPFVGKVLEKNAQRLLFERIFNTVTDPFLLDHTLGRFNHATKLSPLPVLPFVITLEIMAEAAFLFLDCKYRVVKVENLKGHRWIALDTKEKKIVVSAEFGDTGAAQNTIAVKIWDDVPGEKVALLAEATVILKQAYDEQPVLTPLDIDEIKPVKYSAREFNDICLFHGPSFTWINKLVKVGFNGIVLGLKQGEGRIDAGGAGSSFLTPGAILDTAGQLLAYWLVENGDSYFGTFPFQMVSFEQFCDPSSITGEIYCQAQLRVKDDILVSDIKYYQDEKVLYCINGFYSKYYKFPPNFLNLIYWEGPNTYFSEKLTITNNRELLVRWVEDLPYEFLDQSGEIWIRALVHKVCNDEERAIWYQLPENKSRRKEWLFGRIAAKEVVKDYFNRFKGINLYLNEIGVLPDIAGKPIVLCDKLIDLQLTCDISISHSNNKAIAAIVGVGKLVGVDIEFTNTKAKPSLDILFDENESVLIDSSIFKDDCLVLFSAKEAASKCLGQNLLSSLQDWKITGINSVADEVIIQNNDTKITVNYQVTDHYVMTACVVNEKTLKNMSLKKKDPNQTNNK